jgi:hypothetical protein
MIKADWLNKINIKIILDIFKKKEKEKKLCSDNGCPCGTQNCYGEHEIIPIENLFTKREWKQIMKKIRKDMQKDLRYKRL